MTNKTVFGIIPARGGSKGVPRKNIRLMAGKPLLAHTVEAALASGLLDRVVVSTDDEEIAAAAIAAGAEVPFLRPAECATDTASSISVLHHAIAWFSMHESARPGAFALLSPTCPLRTPAQIDGVVDLMWSSGAQSAMTVYPVRDHPYFIYDRKEDGRLQDLMPMANKPLRRQDLPAYFAPSQSVIVARTDYLKLSPDGAPVFNPSSVVGYEIDLVSAFDIDTVTDFEMAEYLLLAQQKRSHVAPKDAPAREKVVVNGHSAPMTNHGGLL